MAPPKPPPSKAALCNVTLEEWIARTQKLIKLDYEEELEQNRVQCEKYSLKELEKSGSAIRKLCITNQRSAFGRQLFQFTVPPLKKDEINLTSFGITNGDIVAVTTQSETASKLSGVVLKMTRTSLEVAFDPNAKELTMFEQAEHFNLIKIANDVTYRRLKQCADDLYRAAQRNYLVGMLFGTEPLQEPLTVLPPYSTYLSEEPEDEDSQLIWFNQNLNDSQKEAISFALHQKHLAIIHGPPGTGKTTTLTEVILQLISRGQKVFCFAPSNVAVDNIFKQLLNASQAMCSRFRLKKPFNFVRLGHPARVDDQLKNYALDQVVLNSDSSVVSDLRAELDQKTKSGTGIRWQRGELKELRQQIAQYENRAFKESLKEANVIFATLTSATLNGQLKYLIDGLEGNDRNSFMCDVALIDECAQSLEIAAWIPLSYARKCILAGDHQQLPATIISEEAAQQGLSISLIERLVHHLYASCPEKVVRMLTVQYRMHHLIMDWPSEYFYKGKLVADESVQERQLLPKNTRGSRTEVEPFPTIRLIDTVGCDMYELELEDSLSKGNKYEADIVCLYIKSLLDAGILPTEIGVISPYRLQTSMIEARCRQQFPDSICNNLEINSVDAFQGREKEVIILSLVRSNDSGSIGFLIEQRRLNVAITRARSHLVVICDSGTVSQDAGALQSFIDYCYEHADVVTATDYLQEMDQFDELKIELKGKKTIANAKEGTKNQKKNLKNKGGNNRKDAPKGNPKAVKPTASKPSAPVNKINDRPTPEQLRAQLEDFATDSTATELKFPESLNSFDRRLVHELCDALGLTHQSVGDHPHRQLIVSKNT